MSSSALGEHIEAVPELHYLGARLWRKGIRDLLQGFVDADEWSEADAIRVVDLIAHETRAAYTV
jgi:hypothetical protein